MRRLWWHCRSLWLLCTQPHRTKKAELEKKAKKAKAQKPKQQVETKTNIDDATPAPPIETDDEVAAMTELSLTEERPTNRKPKKAAAAATAVDHSAGGDASSCRVCDASFDSRSKLFQHLESSGHATIIAATAAAQMSASGT